VGLEPCASVGSAEWSEAASAAGSSSTSAGSAEGSSAAGSGAGSGSGSGSRSTFLFVALWQVYELLLVVLADVVVRFLLVLV